MHDLPPWPWRVASRFGLRIQRSGGGVIAGVYPHTSDGGRGPLRVGSLECTL
jgi:hypothetical protein